MDRKTAENLSAITLEAYFKLHDAVDIVRNGMPQGDERKEYIDGLGRGLGYLYMDVLTPLYKEYPDLKPDNIA
jgi:hypothetical protein